MHDKTRKNTPEAFVPDPFGSLSLPQNGCGYYTLEALLTKLAFGSHDISSYKNPAR